MYKQNIEELPEKYNKINNTILADILDIEPAKDVHILQYELLEFIKSQVPLIKLNKENDNPNYFLGKEVLKFENKKHDYVGLKIGHAYLSDPKRLLSQEQIKQLLYAKVINIPIEIVYFGYHFSHKCCYESVLIEIDYNPINKTYDLVM